jgi:hypothetical protein
MSFSQAMVRISGPGGGVSVLKVPPFEGSGLKGETTVGTAGMPLLSAR